MSPLLAVLAALSLEAAPPVLGCAITGESIDADPAGLRVRAGPTLGSRVIGRLYPSMDPHVYFHEEKATLAEGLVGANFTVDAVRGDWLHIRDIDPITDGLDPEGGLTMTPNHAGEGWVHASKVRLIDFGGGGLRVSPGGPPAAPGSTLDAPIVECRGNWARLRLNDGSTGWLPSRSNEARAATIRAAIQPKAQAR